MKSLVSKLLPGVLASIAVCLGITWLHAQAPTTAAAAPIPATPAPQVIYVDQNGHPIAPPQAQQPQQIIICGHCGAQILAPQAMLVSMPVQPVGPSFYGMPTGYAYAPDCDDSDYRPGAPPQSLLPLSTQWRLPVRAIPALSNQTGYRGQRRY